MYARRRRCGCALLGETGYEVSPQQTAENIRRLSETAADPIFLAVSEGRVLGLVACHLCRMLQYEKPVMRVTALVVDQHARGRGTGKLLMKHAEGLATTKSCDFVELTSAMGRAEAHAFYRSLGYIANSRRFRKSFGRE